jgi:hypothetical protein
MIWPRIAAVREAGTSQTVKSEIGLLPLVLSELPLYHPALPPSAQIFILGDR